MKITSVLVAVISVLFGVAIFSKQAKAQSYHNDAGAMILEDSLLSPNRKQIVFVVAKEINGPTKVELDTISNEGVISHFAPMQFPQGLRRGQVLPIWSGEFNSFNTTPWLYFTVTITSGMDSYYCRIMTPVNYSEQYKEPMITSISETGGYGIPYTITVRGIFDTTEPSMILINTNVFVSPKVITQTPPGKIEFIIDSNTRAEFPPGKYLLTLCQNGHCDTLQGRHR